ncbi:GDSL esterase/lipase At5g45910 [Linum perenne]
MYSSLVQSVAPLLLTLLLTLCIGIHSNAVFPNLNDCGFTAIYCFGDSLYDTGNNLLETPQSFTGNFPYGITIGKPTGRASDGHLIIDHIAEAAGVPYLNPSLNKSLDFSRGANFAMGGSGLLSRKDRERWNVTLKFTNSSLDTQMVWFEQLIKSSYKDPTALRRAMNSSLFVLGGGSADYTNVNAHYTGPLINQKKLILPHAIRALKQAVETIRSYGGRSFVIAGVYEGGCLPGWHNNTMVQYCWKEGQAYHDLHNKAVKKAISRWSQQYPDLRLVYGDVWAAEQWVFDFANAAGKDQEREYCVLRVWSRCMWNGCRAVLQEPVRVHVLGRRASHTPLVRAHGSLHDFSYQ